MSSWADLYIIISICMCLEKDEIMQDYSTVGYSGAHVRVFSSYINNTLYIDLIQDIHARFGFPESSFPKTDLRKITKVSKWLSSVFSPEIVKYVKEEHPVIFSETFYDTICKCVYDDLCGYCHMIDDAGHVIETKLCVLSDPRKQIDQKNVQLVLESRSHTNTRAKVLETNQKEYSKLVSIINGVILSRIDDQPRDYAVKQERDALVNLLSVKLATGLMVSIDEISASISDPMLINKQLEEFILNESKKDQNKL